jgi:hypothetical protein
MAESPQTEQIAHGPGVSLSALAQSFEIARETVKSRLLRANVEPSGEHAGNPLYPLVTSVRVLRASEWRGDVDPDKLAPMERRAHWQAEREKVELLKTTADYCHVSDVRAQFAAIVKSTTGAWDGLIDDLERTAGLTPDQSEAMQRIIDARRAAYFESLAA